MTAVVGILNRKAVAIAADSAVTVNGKIYNRAMKVFTLSKYKPIGVMLYNTDSFMNTPWETIIKSYRRQLGDVAFPTVEDYKNDFIQYIRNRNFFSTPDFQIRQIQQNVFNNLFYALYEQAKKTNIPPADIDNFIVTETTILVQTLNSIAEIALDFQNFSLADFDNVLGNEFTASITDFFPNQNYILSGATQDLLKTICYDLIRKKETFSHYTGLIFTGFGEDEIFPSLWAVNIYHAFDNRLKFFEDRSVQITHEMESSIQPFAQTEAMSTILMGIAPNLELIYMENLQQYLAKYNQLLIQALQPYVPGIDAVINAIDLNAQIQDFQQKMKEAKDAKYVNPLMDAVSTLSKEDLSEMAESLIYLTYLQKRITFAQEDVGGDVDVAIISKGDGFIWVKRKHYFKPELNRYFFDNYFNQ